MNKTPVYMHSRTYAGEHDQLKRYLASYKAHTACKQAIGRAIDENYRDNCLSRDAAKSVIAEFGLKRTMYVVAAAVRAIERDGRIDPDNRAWARSFPLADDTDSSGRDRTKELTLYRTHPCLIDLFTHMVREEAAISSPVYRRTFDDARDAGETAEYRMSCRINELCQTEIDDAVNVGWDGMHVAPDAVKQTLERFGPERVSYILANTVRHREGDERFSSDNRLWAESIPLYVPLEKLACYTVRSHSVKLDDFITTARKEMLQMEKETSRTAKEKRPSVRKKLQAKTEASPAPKPSAKTKSQER